MKVELRADVMILTCEGDADLCATELVRLQQFCNAAKPNAHIAFTKDTLDAVMRAVIARMLALGNGAPVSLRQPLP